MLKANDKKNLIRALSQMDITVPPRTEGRTKAHMERYAIAYLLSTLEGQTELAYPVCLVRRERPDFLLSVGECRIGIEHTEAVPQNEAHKDSLREKGHGPDVYFLSKAQPRDPKKTRNDLIQEIQRDVPGDGSVGDSDDRAWGEAMSHVVQRKLATLRNPGFERFEENWLLIYDNWPFIDVATEHATSILFDLLRPTTTFEEVDRIFILSGHELCDISHCGTRVLTRNELWR